MAEALNALRVMANDDSIRSFLAGANISDILEKIESASELMGNVNAITDAFTGSESFIGANDRFNAVLDAFKEANKVFSEKFSDSKPEDLSNRSVELRSHTADAKLTAIFQTPGVSAAEGNPGHQSVKSYLYPSGNASTNLYDPNSCNLAEPLISAELPTLSNNQNLKNKLDEVKNNVVNAQTDDNNAKKEYDELMKRLSIGPNMGINDLLNLCMMVSTPTAQADRSSRLVTGIMRTIGANGNYTYALQYGDASLSKAQYDANFSKQDDYVHYSLPYFALAIMYEKVGR
ncbi:MAG: hypothetical protein LBQ23_04040 [Puniceicoccales bacterium]|jgi:hypothetical protein|nr:hypothetical protein [Puniceicoccales bacterium]